MMKEGSTGTGNYPGFSSLKRLWMLCMNLYLLSIQYITIIENAEVKMSERVQLKGERKFQERYIIDEKGEKTAVVLPVGEYEELLEDLHDLAIIAERRDEPIIAFEELKKRLIIYHVRHRREAYRKL
jgi:PHD/YefM family antitoxin component YafN of YafNO toxin-antitoxin module